MRSGLVIGTTRSTIAQTVRTGGLDLFDLVGWIHSRKPTRRPLTNHRVPMPTTKKQLYDQLRRLHAGKVTIHWGHRLVGIDTLRRRLRFARRRRRRGGGAQATKAFQPEEGQQQPAAAAAGGGVGGMEGEQGEEEEEEIVVDAGGARVSCCRRRHHHHSCRLSSACTD